MLVPHFDVLLVAADDRAHLLLVFSLILRQVVGGRQHLLRRLDWQRRILRLLFLAVNHVSVNLHNQYVNYGMA